MLKLRRLECHEICMANIAGLGCRDMRGRLSDRLNSVAGRAGARHRRIVGDMGIDLAEDHCSCMTNVAARIRERMVCRFPQSAAAASLACVCTVMARDAVP